MSEAEHEDGFDEARTDEAGKSFPIVGIGASAGGLEALEQFFDNMPSDAGVAFVVVQHLSPDFKSLMDELLARHTTMDIFRVEDGITIQPDSIYLIPPKVNMRLANRRLMLTDQVASETPRHPIDIFFESLADDAGKQAIAVILSGTGSDGSRGIRDVHHAGGLVLAQDVESAGFDGMPRSAAATGCVDVIGPPDKLPGKLLEYLGNPKTFVRGQRVTDNEQQSSGDMYHLFRIFRQNFGIDFSLYKPATINRRLERRMQLGKFDQLAEYINELESDAEELDHLYRDLLVEVTQFFRDPPMFERLRSDIIPKMIEGAGPADELRCWIPGCATGQEAYSIAMIFHDCAARLGRNPKIRIFASDVHQASLVFAGNGLYSETAIESLPDEYVETYLIKESNGYRVIPEVRQTVVFASHDITKDPPFTRINLLTCRNVLIYLEPEVQTRVLAMFHFALVKGGTLNLGPSETTGELGQEFETLDAHWRIYRKLRDVRLPEMNRISLSSPMASIISGRHRYSGTTGRSNADDESWLLPAAYEDLLSKYIPPSLLVNEFHDIIHTFGEARRLLVQPAGRPTVNVLKMVEGDLKTAIGAGLHHADRKDAPMSYSHVEVPTPEGSRWFTVSVEPYKRASRKLFLISFESTSEQPKPRPESAENPTPLDETTSDRVRELERELDYTRESLQSTVEELETSNEELQSTNEELVASNEELQSTNEELHSVNEELHTVNAEYQYKIDELTVTNNDLNNFISSTDIGTIFLDRQLRIRRFTPSATAVVHVMDQDVGRPIHHIGTSFDAPSFGDELQHVLDTGERVERDVTTDDGLRYRMRIQAYRNATNAIEGVVVTFDEITSEEKTRADLEQAELDLSVKDRELQDFAYAVSHDLQAPLRAITSYSTELIERQAGDLPEPVREWATGICENADSLRRMIQALLAYSRIETRSGPFRRVDMDDVVSDVLDQLADEARDKGAEISCEALATVIGDQPALTRLVFHLIENALKYASDEPPRIHVSCKRENTTAVFCVDDNGIGIEPRHHDRAFVMFQRLQTKKGVPGIGEGLAICKRIVDHHGGSIWCDSKVGSGTSLYFRLPLADAST